MSEHSKSLLQCIVSGGQTGVDRGALDAAIAMQVTHGGWCPRGRRAEDGRLSDDYDLRETSSSKYYVRTEQNVIDSDGTLILTVGDLKGGTKLTFRMAEKHHRPCFVVDLSDVLDFDETQLWLSENSIEILNVAGPRESTSPGIAAMSQQFVTELIRRCEEGGHPN